jgi:hypothetical protein
VKLQMTNNQPPITHYQLLTNTETLDSDIGDRSTTKFLSVFVACIIYLHLHINT